MSADARALLARHNLRPRKALGQHFLRDPDVRARIVAAVGAGPGDTVVEIGPGLGALTAPLVAAGARVIAIEKDAALAALLREQVPDADVRVGDALDADLAALARDAGAPPIVAGNLPYQISTPLFFRVAAARAHLRHAVFMVQREVADRLVAAPDTDAYGALTVMLGATMAVRTLFRVSRHCFFPEPEVESAVIRLDPRAAPAAAGDHAALERVVRAAFAQRRKKLRNALAALLPAEAIAAAGIDPGRRGETLAREEFDRLARALQARG